MAIAADELNLLVFRYLQESGFHHSAFVFGHESLLARTPSVDADIPFGSLVGLVQKGLQYVEMERQVQEDGAEASHDHSTSLLRHSARTDIVTTDAVTSVSADTSKLMQGHTSDVFRCAWSPDGSLLLTGAADGTALLWRNPDEGPLRGTATPFATIAHGPSAGEALAVAPPSSAPSASPESVAASGRQDVASAEWRRDGSMVATGCYNGAVRVVSAAAGATVAAFQAHEDSVFALQFNPGGDRLATASVDASVSLWDTTTWERVGGTSSHTHSGPILDLQWQSDTTFATCSCDRTIQIHRVGADRPTRVFAGHSADINRIRWDPSAAILASCSDDGTVRLWSPREGPLYSFEGHSKEVYHVDWAPSGPGSPRPSDPPMLVSASLDSTVRVWDPSAGACRLTLRGHTGTVYVARFSPDGQLVASGSFDRRVLVWSVRDGSIVRSFTGSGGVFDVAWHPNGGRLAACFSDGVVSLLDMREGAPM